MSLLNRVHRAACVDSHDDEEAARFAQFKNAVFELVSADSVATLQANNPQKARNEVRSACKRVFEKPLWSDVEQAMRLLWEDQLVDIVFGFGPLEKLLDNPAVTEIMVNGPFRIYFEKEGKLYLSDTHFADENQLRALIDRILGPLGRRIDESSPMVNARLPEGHRVHAIVPPLALNGPVLTIRKFSESVMTLDEMLGRNSLDARMKQFLIWAVQGRKNIAVSGGTGSGKTTLLNALSCVISPTERIITIEDSAELRFLEHPHVIRLEARPRNAEGKGAVSIRDLVTNSLRMRPDRIIVGECRGAEALDMLQAMNTGHDGSLTTLHANSARESIVRLTTMVRFGADLPVDVIEASIAGALDVVVQTARSLDGSRRIAEVAALSYDRASGRCEVTTLFERSETAAEGSWKKPPEWLADLTQQACAKQSEVTSWLRECSLVA